MLATWLIYHLMYGILRGTPQWASFFFFFFFLCANAGSTCDSQADNGNSLKESSDQGNVGSIPTQGNYSFP